MGIAIGGVCFLIISSVALLPTLEARQDVRKGCFDVEGLLVPVFVPMNCDGDIALDVIPQYAQFLKDKGVNGVVVADFIGEGLTLNVSDNKKLLDAWMDAAPPLNLLVVSSVGGAVFSDTIEMARYSEEVGVDAIFAFPEVFYRPKTPEEVVYNLELIAEAAPNTGLVYEDEPKLLPRLDIVDVFELAKERISTFRGIKSSVFKNLLKLRPLITGEQKLYGDNYFYLESEVTIGIESFVMPELNFLSNLIINTINNGREGNLIRSKNQYQRLVTLINSITENGHRIAAYKAAMPIMTGVYLGEPRAPIYPLSKYQKLDLESRLRDQNIKIVETYYID